MPSITLSSLQALSYLIMITILWGGCFKYTQFKDEQLNFGEFQQLLRVIQSVISEPELKSKLSDSKARILKL